MSAGRRGIERHVATRRYAPTLRNTPLPGAVPPVAPPRLGCSHPPPPPRAQTRDLLRYSSCLVCLDVCAALAWYVPAACIGFFFGCPVVLRSVHARKIFFLFYLRTSEVSHPRLQPSWFVFPFLFCLPGLFGFYPPGPFILLLP